MAAASVKKGPLGSAHEKFGVSTPLLLLMITVFMSFNLLNLYEPGLY